MSIFSEIMIFCYIRIALETQFRKSETPQVSQFAKLNGLDSFGNLNDYEMQYI